MNSDAGEDKPVKQKATDSPRTAESSPGQESTSSRPPKKNFVEVTELTDITYKPSQHSQWMDSLMEAAPDARPSDCLDEEEGEEESTSNKSDYTGHVLALNGHKKYFCIFRPVFTGEEAECSRWSDEDVTRKASRSRSSSRQKATTLEIHHKLDRLGQFYHGVKFEVSDTSTTRLLKIEVQSVKVDCKVTSRFAHTVMTTKALNKANVSQEVSFEVELPKTSFITNFSMEIDGKTYTGEVKEKEKAKEQYQKAVASGQTAGLVKASGRKMEKFSVSVNIVADIYEPQGIAFVDAYGTFMTNELLPLVEKTVTDKKAHVSFSPTLDQQRKCTECEGTLIDGDFFIKYDVNRPHDIGDIQIVNGYFVHFFAPANLPRVPKMVVFVIDNSLSMVGNKMAQTKEALVTILGELPEEDYFAIIVFSSYFVVWRPHLSKATQENVKAAQEYVKTIEVFGSTELHNAVIHGVEMLYEERRNGTAPKNMVMMIILLTDGEPNKYPRSLPEIQESIRNANDGNITIFSLAFGNDANYGFLDTLSKQNNGLVRRIYEDSDAPLQLAVVKLDVHFRYPDNTVNSLTKSHFKQLYNGSEIMVAGRLNDLNDIDSFAFEVFAQGFDNNFEVKGQASTQKWETIFPDEEYIFGDFTERLWAYLTIQELLNKKSV
ncbi:inter-alpha-trypsin inhibitor heavy chain H3-like protein [Labeo rohita]|uniref:Inter-alpha-trypsin inhibitor heavy chain H3-like protein n=1 Tax=Labeo rohita TaxID=84645 RepID=A0A498MYQ7_LABRO|nr:inter-alpha-trypsin inhibitor heavy chain H3-like protein [Labeo rohita]